MDARTCSGEGTFPEQECKTRNGNVKQRQIVSVWTQFHLSPDEIRASGGKLLEN